MKIWVGVVTFLIIILGWFLYNKTSTKTLVTTPSPVPSAVVVSPVNITASFTIKTDNIIRNFSNPKYHNKSNEVFITADNPSVIYVKKAGITWQDFFNTLPMKLTKECLTTGDGEKLCNTNGELKFYINDVEDKDVLDKQIKEGDKLLVTFTATLTTTNHKKYITNN